MAGFGGTDSYSFGYSTSAIRLDLRGGDQSIFLDARLGSGQVINDGYGNTETYTLGGNPNNNSETAIVKQFQLGAFSDVAIGTANNETFVMLGGDDTVKAGDGYDRLRFDRSGIEGITLDLTVSGNRPDDLGTTEIDESIAYDGTAVGAYNDGNGSVGFTVYFNDFEEYRGSRQDDEMIADNSGVRFDGRSGNDTLVGGTGNDTLIGGSGSNEFFDGDGDDEITLRDGSGSQFVQAGAGNDVIDFATESLMDAFVSFGDLTSRITVYVNENGQSDRADKGVQGTTNFFNINDVIGSYGLGLEGTNQADTFFVTNTDSDGFISVRGGDGVDVYNFGVSAGTMRFDLRGGDGAVVNLSLGSNQVIDDGFGNEESIGDITRISELRTTDGDDSVIGSTGNDWFIMRKGSDTLEAGDGVDTLRYDRSFVDSVNVDLEDSRAYDGKFSGGYASGFWSDNSGNGTFETFLSDVEYVRGSREGNDELLGDSSDNRFDGRGGDDTLNGRGGIDTIVGEGGNDTLLADSGADDLNGGNGANSLRGAIDDDTLEGGFGNDAMFGDNDNDVMTAIGGLNLMFGGFGNDSITGGSATDTLNGGSGADAMDGGNSGDVFIIEGDGVIDDTGASGFDNVQILSQTGDGIDLALWSGAEWQA